MVASTQKKLDPKERKGNEYERHEIVTQYLAAFDTSDLVAARLTADILKKDLVGKPTADALEDVVGFLHSEDVAQLIKKALGSRAKDLSDKEILDKYGLPKHVIRELLNEYESITPEVLMNLSQQLSARLHAELTSHHPAALANLAYDQGHKEAQAVLMDLYAVSGGEKYARAHKKSIEDLLTPDKISDHLQTLYQRRELQQRSAQDSDRTRGALYGKNEKGLDHPVMPKATDKKYKRREP